MLLSMQKPFPLADWYSCRQYSQEDSTKIAFSIGLYTDRIYYTQFYHQPGGKVKMTAGI